MAANRQTNSKMLAAVIGGSAIIAMGAVTAAITGEHSGPAVVTSSGMTVGVTTTPPATPASAPATSFAVPPVKAKPYGG
jgi:hypothetical protein